MSLEIAQDRLDATLERLLAGALLIRQSLVELEVDANRELLEGTALEGRSAALWATAGATLAEAWRSHELLDALLARAVELRGTRRLRPAQLDQLKEQLEGQSITLAGAAKPHAQRCSPSELLSRMSAALDQVERAMVQVGGAWETLIPRVEAARGMLAETVQLADELGEPGRRDLAAAAERLAALGASLTTDPLSVAPGEVEALAHSLQAIRRDLDSTAELSRDFAARIELARNLLEQLRATALEAEKAQAELILKISVPTTPSAPAIDDELEAQLARVVALGEGRAWRDGRIALEHWAARTSESLSQAQRVLSAYRAPIQARNQLRALLEAYQAKAKQLGLVEDPELAEIFARAQEMLHCAPTDLARAGELVRRYQAALGGLSVRPETLL